MTHHPLSRFAPSPFKGDDGLGCGAALAGRPAPMTAPLVGAAMDN